MADLRSVLEAALWEDPDDLSAHMAYGDHLAEQGDPRGEFIQVQIALEDAKLRPARRAELKAREAEIRSAHEAGWLGGLSRPPLHLAVWERGWLAEVTLSRLGIHSAQTLVGCHAARLLRRLDVWENPTIQVVAPDDAALPPEGVDAGADASALAVLCGAAFLPCLRSLRVGPGYNNERHQGFAVSTARGLAGVVARTGVPSAELFGMAGRASRLEELTVHCDGLDLRRLFALPLPALRHVELLHGTALHPLGVLANNAGWPMLESLRIIPQFDDEDARPIPLREAAAFLESRHFPRLRELCLEGAEVGDEGCRRLVRSGVLRRLRTLELRNGGIGDAGARALAWCADTERLARLDLRGNPIGRAGVGVLKEYHIKVELEAGPEPAFQDDME